ncbi:hypothetical protein [Nonomuraea sp. NPDC049400]|uniref:hypothetical protein n=1 Tax=Nonomuraea sp. NPDC049400 TaxID=3364352 RepID=UPI00378FF64E
MDNDVAVIADFELELDDHEDDRSKYTPVEDRALRLLGRDNRVAISLRQPRTVETEEPGRAAYDIGLMLALHPHPRCRFAWARLLVDLSSTPDAIIEDMVPHEVDGRAVDVETRVGLGLKFAAVFSTVDLEANPELARKSSVFLPRMTASGIGFRKAYWDFTAHGGDYLHTNGELRLLVSAPVGQAVTASMAVRAHLRLPGLMNLVPVRKRRDAAATVELVSLPAF